MTQPGVILGTAAYMAPEQAKGRAADIWVFGCILYECLTGKRAFAGETISETLAAILNVKRMCADLAAICLWRQTGVLNDKKRAYTASRQF